MTLHKSHTIGIEPIVLVCLILWQILLLINQNMTMLRNSEIIGLTKRSNNKAKEMSKDLNVRANSISMTQHFKGNHLVYTIGN